MTSIRAVRGIFAAAAVVSFVAIPAGADPGEHIIITVNQGTPDIVWGSSPLR